MVLSIAWGWPQKFDKSTEEWKDVGKQQLRWHKIKTTRIQINGRGIIDDGTMDDPNMPMWVDEQQEADPQGGIKAQ